jgi:hypothetical protein
MRALCQTTLLVFNGLSWTRTGLVEVDHLPAELREGQLIISDLADGQPVAYEDVPGTHRQIVFPARDVPAAGYKLYSVAKGPAAAASGEFPVDVKCDAAGNIVSILDRKSGHEILEEKSERPFGSLWIARGRGGFQMESGKAEVTTKEGAVRRRIEIARKGTALPLTIVTTYRDRNYADFRFDVDLSRAPDTSGNLQYALALPLPRGQQMFVDGAGFVTRISQDLLPGGGPPRYTPVHFLHLRQATDWGITLANQDSAFVTSDLLFPVATESDTAQTRDEGTQQLFRTEPRGSSVQSFRFRVAVEPEAKWQWERTGEDLNLPLRATLVANAIPPYSRSFFAVDRPEVQIVAFKPAESQPGWYVLRFQEIGGTEVKRARLLTPFEIVEALAGNTVEEAGETRVDLSNLSLKPWETLSCLIRIRAAADRP